MNTIATLANNGPVTMSSREIADLLEKQHSHLKISAERLAEKGVIGTLATREFTHNGNVYTEYLLNKRDSLILVAQNCPEFTARIVDRWQELEAAQAPALPKTFAQALRLAAEQQERIEAQQLKIEADRPKVAYADALLNSDGTTLVRDVAKTLGVGPVKLHKALKEKGVILGNNAPAAEYVQKGYFVETTSVYKTKTAGDRIAHAARVTGRGIEFIRRFIARHGDLLTQHKNRGVMQ